MNITIKGLPEDVIEKDIYEWVSVYVERHYNKRLVPPQVDVEKAKVDLDDFREENKLDPKYRAISVEPIEEPIEPK